MFEFRSVFPKIAKPESRNYCNASFMLLYSKYCTHFEYPWVCQMPGGREKIDCQMPGGREYFLCKCPGVSRGGMVRVGIERDIIYHLLLNISTCYPSVCTSPAKPQV